MILSLCVLSPQNGCKRSRPKSVIFFEAVLPVTRSCKTRALCLSWRCRRGKPGEIGKYLKQRVLKKIPGQLEALFLIFSTLGSGKQRNSHPRVLLNFHLCPQSDLRIWSWQIKGQSYPSISTSYYYWKTTENGSKNRFLSRVRSAAMRACEWWWLLLLLSKVV